MAGEPQWLTKGETDAWLATVTLMLALPNRLDAQLQRDSGMTLFEYLVLSWLSMTDGGTARMSELARLVNGSLSRLSNVARRLEARGLLSRSPDPDDGRYTLARLTAAGRRAVVKAAPGHVAAVREWLIDPLSAAQVRALGDVGRTLRPRFEC